jgi:hypothetical protein
MLSVEPIYQNCVNMQINRGIYILLQQSEKIRQKVTQERKNKDEDIKKEHRKNRERKDKQIKI